MMCGTPRIHRRCSYCERAVPSPQAGQHLLLQDGLEKAALGITDLSELTRIGAQTYLESAAVDGRSPRRRIVTFTGWSFVDNLVKAWKERGIQ